MSGAFRLLMTIGAVVLVAWVAGSAGARQLAGIYTAHPLVSDSTAGQAPAVDASLVNGWGLSAGPTTPWWTANNGSNTSTLYNGVGAKSALTVAVPGAPTGTVFNGNAAAFVVSQNGKSGAARFLFATEGGTIMGWSPTVNATVAVGRRPLRRGAIYKGLAIANGKLYATDFHNGRVDVFDKSFNLVSGGFTDPKIPKGFAPFGIQALAGNIFVTYAQAGHSEERRCAAARTGVRRRVHPRRRTGRAGRQLAEEERAPERGLGPRSRPSRLQRLRRRPPRRELRQRPHQRLLQRDTKWVYRGQLRHADGTPIEIEGLWAIAFGNGAAAGPTNTLYFLAGPGGETHGLFGSITTG